MVQLVVPSSSISGSEEAPSIAKFVWNARVRFRHQWLSPYCIGSRRKVINVWSIITGVCLIAREGRVKAVAVASEALLLVFIIMITYAVNQYTKQWIHQWMIEWPFADWSNDRAKADLPYRALLKTEWISWTRSVRPFLYARKRFPETHFFTNDSINDVDERTRGKKVTSPILFCERPSDQSVLSPVEQSFSAMVQTLRLRAQTRSVVHTLVLLGHSLSQKVL